MQGRLSLASTPGRSRGHVALLAAKVDSGVQSGDREALGRAAHALTGAASNFDGGPAVLAAAELERIGREGDLADAAEVSARLATEIARLTAAVQAFWEVNACGS